jgi:hypothetical protein
MSDAISEIYSSQSIGGIVCFSVKGYLQVIHELSVVFLKAKL